MSKRARRKEQRPGEILAAAFEAFAERGFEATRLEDVAALAGVTKGTIYVYFETKEKLFAEMVRHYSSGILADADAVFEAAQGSSSDRLRQFLDFVYRRSACDRTAREMLRFVISEGKNFPGLVEEHHRDFVAPAMRLIGRIIADGVACGEFRADLSNESAEIVIAPAIFLGVQRLIFANSLPVDEAAYVNAHMDLVLRSLSSGVAHPVAHESAAGSALANRRANAPATSATALRTRTSNPEPPA